MYKKLEELGFFEWLDKVHNLVDTDMKPEYLDKLPLGDIHRTVCNAMVFRWFMEKYELSSWIYNTNSDRYFYTILKDGRFVKDNEARTTYEEAENACIEKLIELAKQQDNEQ